MRCSMRSSRSTEYIDILVNNAGGQFMAPAESITYNGFRAVTRLNLDAAWYITTQVASRSMIERGYGKIVSITMTPRRGLPGMSHSSAARAGLSHSRGRCRSSGASTESAPPRLLRGSFTLPHGSGTGLIRT